MTKLVKATIATLIAAPLALIITANAASAGGTIKSGDYETICDKNPSACGEDLELPPRKPTPPPPPPAPKASKNIHGHLFLHNGYTPISRYTPISKRRARR